MKGRRSQQGNAVVKALVFHQRIDPADRIRGPRNRVLLRWWPGLQTLVNGLQHNEPGIIKINIMIFMKQNWLL